jgi:hypothetical protein
LCAQGRNLQRGLPPLVHNSRLKSITRIIVSLDLVSNSQERGHQAHPLIYRYFRVPVFMLFLHDNNIAARPWAFTNLKMCLLQHSATRQIRNSGQVQDPWIITFNKRLMASKEDQWLRPGLQWHVMSHMYLISHMKARTVPRGDTDSLR